MAISTLPVNRLTIASLARYTARSQWSDPPPPTDIKGNLLFENGLLGVEECPIRPLRLGPVRQSSCLANASGGLATLDDGSSASIARGKYPFGMEASQCLNGTLAGWRRAL